MITFTKEKLKKIIFLLLTFIMLPFIGAAALDTVTIYSPMGEAVSVYSTQLKPYFELGWVENYEDAKTDIYTGGGQSARVFCGEVPKYLKLGWFASYEEATVRIYNGKGQPAVIFLDELSEYLSLGWYENYEDTLAYVYDKYGTSYVIFIDEVPFYISNGFFIPQKEIDPLKPMVALTFDDGPGIYTDEILDTLEKYGGHATFFVVGQLVSKYPQTVKREYSIGCEIGNHTYNHARLTELHYKSVVSQINDTSAMISNITGEAPSLLRPPYGRYNNTTKQASDVPLILWSIDTLDWKTRNADSTVNTVMSSVRDGDIILMHDIYEPSAEAAVRLIPKLMSSGYQLVTVSELAFYKGKVLSKGISYGRIK